MNIRMKSSTRSNSNITPMKSTGNINNSSSTIKKKKLSQSQSQSQQKPQELLQTRRPSESQQQPPPQLDSSEESLLFTDVVLRGVHHCSVRGDGGIPITPLKRLATDLQQELRENGSQSPRVETPVDIPHSLSFTASIMGPVPSMLREMAETPHVSFAPVPLEDSNNMDAVNNAGNISVVVRVRPRRSNNNNKPLCCNVIDPQQGIIEHITSSRQSPPLIDSVRFAASSYLPRESSKRANSESQSPESKKRTFTFDAILDEYASQRDTMACVGHKLLQCILQGYNGTILCYGQSGSGKTHTILGPGGEKNDIYLDGEHVGLLPRMLGELFLSLRKKYAGIEGEEEEEEEKKKEEEDDEDYMEGEGRESVKINDENWLWQVHISAVELYQEELRDLLFHTAPRSGSEYGGGTSSSSSSMITIKPTHRYSASIISDSRNSFSPLPSGRHSLSRPSHRPELHIRDVGTGVQVEGLSWHKVCDFNEAMRAVNIAVQQRQVASTALNARSSRSHLLFFVRVQQRDPTMMAKKEQHGGDYGWVQSLLTFVDLAGSERVAATGAEGLQLKEAQRINLSLTLLGNVIRKLSAAAAANIKREELGHIPFRDSKLTRLLRDSVGGNTITVLLCTILPDGKNATETLSTLNFAKDAKLIRNRPVVNRITTMAELQAKLLAAERRIASLEQEKGISERKYLEQQQKQKQQQEQSQQRQPSQSQHRQEGDERSSGNGLSDADPLICPMCSTHISSPKGPFFSQDHEMDMNSDEAAVRLDFYSSSSAAAAAHPDVFVSKDDEIKALRAKLMMMTNKLHQTQAELMRVQSRFLEERQKTSDEEDEKEEEKEKEKKENPEIPPAREKEKEKEQQAKEENEKQKQKQRKEEEEEEKEEKDPSLVGTVEASYLVDSEICSDDSPSLMGGWRHVRIPPTQTPTLRKGLTCVLFALVPWAERFVPSAWLRNTAAAAMVESLNAVTSLPLSSSSSAAAASQLKKKRKQEREKERSTQRHIFSSTNHSPLTADASIRSDGPHSSSSSSSSCSCCSCDCESNSNNNNNNSSSMSTTVSSSSNDENNNNNNHHHNNNNSRVSKDLPSVLGGSMDSTWTPSSN
ncbi:putative kinesin, partial [Trypanosoma theileri]